VRSTVVSIQRDGMAAMGAVRSGLVSRTACSSRSRGAERLEALLARGVAEHTTARGALVDVGDDHFAPPRAKRSPWRADAAASAVTTATRPRDLSLRVAHYQPPLG